MTPLGAGQSSLADELEFLPVVSGDAGVRLSRVVFTALAGARPRLSFSRGVRIHSVRVGSVLVAIGDSHADFADAAGRYIDVLTELVDGYASRVLARRGERVSVEVHRPAARVVARIEWIR